MRRSLSQKTRFKVFERDGFACRYCGRKSPEVEIQVDHCTPCSKGGSNDLDNLVTACWDCNIGKRDREILCVPPRLLSDVFPVSASFLAIEIGGFLFMLDRAEEKSGPQMSEISGALEVIERCGMVEAMVACLPFIPIEMGAADDWVSDWWDLKSDAIADATECLFGRNTGACRRWLPQIVACLNSVPEYALQEVG